MGGAADGAPRAFAIAGPAETIAGAVAPLLEHLLVDRRGHVYRDVVALVERPLIEHALRLTGGNQLRAARLLGLNRNTLRKRCRQLGLLQAPAPPLNGARRDLP